MKSTIDVGETMGIAWLLEKVKWAKRMFSIELLALALAIGAFLVINFIILYR